MLGVLDDIDAVFETLERKEDAVSIKDTHLSALSNQVVANTRDLRKVAASQATIPLPPLPPMIDTSSMHTLYTPQLLSYDSAKQVLTKPPPAAVTSPSLDKPLLSILKNDSPPSTNDTQKKGSRRSVGFGVDSVRTFVRGSLVHQHETSSPTTTASSDPPSPAPVINSNPATNANHDQAGISSDVMPSSSSVVPDAAVSASTHSSSGNIVHLQPLRGHNHLPDSQESISARLASIALESPEEAEARADAEAAAEWKPTEWAGSNEDGSLNRDRAVRAYVPKKHNPFVAWTDAPATYSASGDLAKKVQEARLAKPAPSPTPDEKPNAATGTYKRPIKRKPRVPVRNQESSENKSDTPDAVSHPTTPVSNGHKPAASKPSTTSLIMQSRVTERPPAPPAPVIAATSSSSIEGYDAVPSEDKVIWQEIFGTPFPSDAAEFVAEEEDDLIESNAILKKNCFTNMWMCLEDMMPVSVIAWLNMRDDGPVESTTMHSTGDDDENSPMKIEEQRKALDMPELLQRQNVVRLLSRAILAVENLIKLEAHIGTTATEYHHVKNTLMSKLSYNVNPTFSSVQWQFFALLLVDAILRHRIHGPLNISTSEWNAKFYEHSSEILKCKDDLLGEREIILLRTYFNFDADDDF